jgi:threonine-phosphate decarboxylase
MTPPLHGGQLRHIADRFNIPAAELLDLSANINPEGPSPTVLATLRAALDDPSILTSYPDLDQPELKQAIATCTGLTPQNISVANGFVPLLESTLRTLNIQCCLLPVPAFVEYRRTLERARVQATPIPLDPETSFRYNIDALRNTPHDAILLANPQNPSGLLTTRETLRDLVTHCADRNIVVLLDEAFIDYAPTHSLTPQIDQHPNLVVFRSVTKFHGIPGLRVAYAAANPTLAHAINAALPPWPITTLASRAAAAALADRLYAEQTIQLNQQRKAHLETALNAARLHVYPSAANFLLFRIPSHLSPESFWHNMILHHHIVLRDCSNYESLQPGHFRTAVSTEANNTRLIQALARATEKLSAYSEKA